MYKLILPIRYLLKRRITYLAVAAVALCVFVALVVITVLSGLTNQFKQKIHNFVGDCVVSTRSVIGFEGYEQFAETLKAQPFVAAVAPVIRVSGLVKARSSIGQAEDAPREIIGIDPNSHFLVTAMASDLNWHPAAPGKAFSVPYDAGLPGCMAAVGILADRDEQGKYSLPERIPRISFEITLLPLTAKGTPAKAATDLVNTKTYWLSDTVNSGIARVDWTTMYLPFDQVQMLCGMNLGDKRATALYIKFKNGTDEAAACAKVADLWKTYLSQQPSASPLAAQVTVRDWRSYQREVIAAVETEQKMMTIIIGMLGVITVFIVFVVFYMIISHKSKDIGILKSLGASTFDITSLFLLFGFLVGALGAGIGALAGWQFLVNINRLEALLLHWFHFQLWNRRLYALNEIPNTIYSEVLIMIIASAIIASVLGAFFPSLRGARRKPVQSLQVNQL